MKRWLSWAAVSTEEQADEETKDSIRVQLEENRNHVEKLGGRDGPSFSFLRGEGDELRTIPTHTGRPGT